MKKILLVILAVVAISSSIAELKVMYDQETENTAEYKGATYKDIEPVAAKDTASTVQDAVQPVSEQDVADNADKESAAADDETKAASEPTVSLEEKIMALASEKARPEENSLCCRIDVESATNPYGVDWNYGSNYDRFTEKLDWGMVFDADFYMEQFPMLAMQYQYDEALLLEHFRTVGVHEGRLASSNFSVEAYMQSCPQKIKGLFGDNYAAYTLYYIAEGYKNVNPSDVMASSSSKRMLTAVMTDVQKLEMEQINEERKRLGVNPLEFNPELAAAAEFRAWIDAKEGWAAHDWMQAPENKGTINQMYAGMGTKMLSENTVKCNTVTDKNWYRLYEASEKHYEAMVNDVYTYLGISNAHIGPHEVTKTVQFDMFMKKDAATPLE